MHAAPAAEAAEAVDYAAAPRRLRAAVVAVAALTPADKRRMFELMRSYYDAVSEAQFLSDLSSKDAVILLRDRTSAEIQGFSTLRAVRVSVNGKLWRGVFSGDTVIDKRYWGQRELGRAFLRYLFAQKLKKPFSPLYWLLISKGYKTYLLMANNFAEHWPRRERATPPEVKTLMDAFYGALYPDSYDAATGLIETPGEACRLKAGVAAVSPSLAAANPRVEFFERANPEWRRGVELACLARMTLWMPLRYGLKALVKGRLRAGLERIGMWFSTASGSKRVTRER
jgi:hypothetical protein